MLPRPRLFVKKRGTRRTGSRWAGEVAEGLLSAGLIAAGAFGLYWLIHKVVTVQGAGWWPWFAMVIPVALFVYGVIGLVGLLALVRGWHHSGRTTLLALSAAMLFFQIHAGWALAFQNGDVPKDMLVYVQTSPDVTRFMKELDEFSELQTGGKDLPIYFDDSTSWPFNWYLRNYTRKNFFSCSTNGCTLAGAPNEGTAIVLVGNDNLASHPELTSQLSDFVGQPYEMRWNYPEEVYRVFALAPELDPGWNAWSTEQQPYTLTKVIGSVFASTTASFTPQGQANLFRILAYHDLRQPLGTYGFTVFVHKDLLPQFNAIRYR